MTQTITHDIEELIARQIEAGNYRSFDEAVNALKSFVTDDRLIQKTHAAWLQREIQKGEDSGGEIPAEEVFAAARDRLKAAQ